MPDLPCHQVFRDDSHRLAARPQHGVREHPIRPTLPPPYTSPIFRRTSSAPNSSAAARYSGRLPELEPQKTQIHLMASFYCALPQPKGSLRFGGRDSRHAACGFCYFFGYPTDCAKMIFCCGRNFRVFVSAGLSTLPRTTVASPSDAQ